MGYRYHLVLRCCHTLYIATSNSLEHVFSGSWMQTERSDEVLDEEEVCSLLRLREILGESLQ